MSTRLLRSNDLADKRLLQYNGRDPLEPTLDDLIEQAIELKEDLQENWFDLGKKLTEIAHLCRKERQFTRILGRMNIPVSTAGYLRNIAVKFEMMEIIPPKDVSWRHIAEVYRDLNLMTYDHIIEQCRYLTREELVKKSRRGDFRLI